MKNSNELGIAFSLGFLLLVLPLREISAADYLPTDQIFLNCGSPGDSYDPDGRKWTSDIGSAFAISTSKSLISSAASQKPSVPSVPYLTGRIFESDFTYSFPVASGRLFLRLHFYSASYSDLNASDAVFSVSANGFTLLRNFSAAQMSEALKLEYIMKEFSIHVPVGEVLYVTFSPSKNASSAYAFVNGIEVNSHPDIYSTDGTEPVVGQSTGFVLDNTTALENVYRLNVGGRHIPPSGDTGLFRSWSSDSNYTLGSGVTDYTSAMNITYPSGSPTYIAPIDVYASLRSMGPNAYVNLNYNLTWIFTIDSGFSYLVRLHFCEFTNNVTKVNQRVFSIFINNRTALLEADVIYWAGGKGVAVHRDYFVFVPKGPPQQLLWLQLHPYLAHQAQYADAILNGLEIFKVNDTTGNLAGLNPVPQQNKHDASSNRVSGSGKNSNAAIGGAVGGGIAAVLVVCLLIYVILRRKKQGKDSVSDNGDVWLPLSLNKSSQTSSSHSYLCRHFSIAEIKAATKNFNEALLLGVGGFGKVYRGEIDSGMKVAIKRGNPLSKQGLHEFQTEIEMLSKLRHRHLVSLIGYCEENSEMILVYDYMAHGTLREHLYSTRNPPLSWKQRLEICIGAARGLHYLHSGAKHTIIHRDVKTTNILLDENWVAKVSDFGLSKTAQLSLDQTHVSTVVKGSFGYLDPEYFRRQQLTEKSDVYSFGVVLFEIICARPALDRALPKEQVSLAEWGERCYRKGNLEQQIDPYLQGKISGECFEKFAETAVKCVADIGTDRPSMGDVVWNLEFSLELQKSADGLGGKTKGESLEIWKTTLDGNTTDSKSTGMSMSVASVDSDGLTPSGVFSQIMNASGR